MIGTAQAKILIDLARESIRAGFSRKSPKVSATVSKQFSEPSGVFVTLTLNEALRGCIGFSDALYPLYRAVIDAAQSAAFKDPRFPPLSEEEFKQITIEVSILSKPVVIEVRNPGDYFQKIVVGRDGLLVRGTFSSGLLLPQVAVEQKWNAKTFLEQACVKAGMPPNEYANYDNCRVYAFQSQVFSEQSPSGQIVQKL